MPTLQEYRTEDTARETMETRVPWPTRSTAPQPSPVKTLWPVQDLLLVLAFAALLVAAAFTVWQRSSRSQAREKLIADFLAAEDAFLTYLQANGSAPADTPPGQVPPGMETYLRKFDRTAPSSLGGSFRWTHRTPPPADSAANKSPASVAGGTISLTAFQSAPPLRLSTADLIEIDRRIDDGDLTTGKFRAGFNGWPVLTVQAKR
jgi:type II secretory pathway pseudopilin PulG